MCADVSSIRLSNEEEEDYGRWHKNERGTIHMGRAAFVPEGRPSPNNAK